MRALSKSSRSAFFSDVAPLVCHVWVTRLVFRGRPTPRRVPRWLVPTLGDEPSSLEADSSGLMSLRGAGAFFGFAGPVGIVLQLAPSGCSHYFFLRQCLSLPQVSRPSRYFGHRIYRSVTGGHGSGCSPHNTTRSCRSHWAPGGILQAQCVWDPPG